jgi:glycosyltransferase involved in cell wall biosynthesis
VVVSHKPCWPSPDSPTGFATDGGFPMQMRALAELFDETRVLVPCAPAANRNGEIALGGHRLRIVPLSAPTGTGMRRKLAMIAWAVRNGIVILREVNAAGAVHVPIPGDVGTIGMLVAFALRKPLCVRHCGNWQRRATPAEALWRWFMERAGGRRNLMLATGGMDEPPSPWHPHIRWIFSTSLTERELAACALERDNPAPRLILVGRQERGKGTEILLDAAWELSGELPDLTVDVVGDGSALNEFRARAASLGLRDRVRFHGKVDRTRVIELLQGAGLFCFPTASEGFPKVVLEAMACGLPVITTRVSVLPFLIGADCGVILEERGAPALAEAVRRCLRDGDAYRRMSRAAIARARQYSLERWRDTIGEWMRAAWGPLRSE